ncbi:MAG: sensor histidine kinase [Nocardioidaceae bacterium]
MDQSVSAAAAAPPDSPSSWIGTLGRPARDRTTCATRPRWREPAIWLAALVVGLLEWWAQASRQYDQSPTLFWVDLGIGAASMAVLPMRHRAPILIALTLLPATALSQSAGGAVGVVLVTVAIYRRIPAIVLVGVLHMVAGMVFFALEPSPGVVWWVHLLILVVVLTGAMGWGMYIGARRDLLASLRERAERAESEQALRVARARDAERARIAREMHDVLAHRISLVCMHAGALSYRHDLSREEIAASADIISTNAHEALHDLREVIGVLREGPGGQTPAPPQPTLRDLPALVDEARNAGMKVDWSADLPDDVAPDSIGRAAYRIVQEGLTNARKHAPGTRVRVRVDGQPGHDLLVCVDNPLRMGGPVNGASIPGSGNGLLGLGERAALAGGRIEHLERDDRFVLTAWLPWPS